MQGYSKTFFSIINMNNLSLAELKLPEFSPSDDVLALIQQYISLVVPQISRVMDSIAAGIQENYTTCVLQKVRTRLGTSAPEDVFTMVRVAQRVSSCWSGLATCSRRSFAHGDRSSTSTWRLQSKAPLS